MRLCSDEEGFDGGPGHTALEPPVVERMLLHNASREQLAVEEIAGGGAAEALDDVQDGPRGGQHSRESLNPLPGERDARR